MSLTRSPPTTTWPSVVFHRSKSSSTASRWVGPSDTACGREAGGRGRAGIALVVVLVRAQQAEWQPKSKSPRARNIRAVPVPILILQGEEDEVIPVETTASCQQTPLSKHAILDQTN